MADDASSANAAESSQARDVFRPVVMTRIGRAWLETLTARAEADDAAEAGDAGKAAAVAAPEGAQDSSLIETPEGESLPVPEDAKR